MALPVYEVYAIKYAERGGRRPEHFIGGDPHDGPIPMDYFIWLVRNSERLIVVDTGFDAAVAAKRKRTLVRPMLTGDKLASVGADVPAAIDSGRSRLLGLALALVCLALAVWLGSLG